jgi:hypothetical protein
MVSVDGKLDTCGSVSLAHSSYMRDVAPCRSYGLKAVTLSGIGGMSEPLMRAGLLHVRTLDGGRQLQGDSLVQLENHSGGED